MFPASVYRRRTGSTNILEVAGRKGGKYKKYKFYKCNILERRKGEIMKKASRFSKSFLAAVLAFACIAGSGMPTVVKAAETPANTNLALDKTVTASAEYNSMPASNLTDSDTSSRWSAENGPTQSAYVDLGKSYSMNYFSIIWESDTNYASKYNIYVSDNTDDWGEAVVTRTDNASSSSEETLEQAVKGRYVKLEVTAVAGYPNVSARDFKVMLKDESQSTPQDPEENVALNKTGQSSSNETADLNASKAQCIQSI